MQSEKHRGVIWTVCVLDVTCVELKKQMKIVEDIEKKSRKQTICSDQAISFKA